MISETTVKLSNKSFDKKKFCRESQGLHRHDKFGKWLRKVF